METCRGHSKQSKDTCQCPERESDGVKHGHDSFKDKYQHDNEHRKSTELDRFKIGRKSIVYCQISQISTRELERERVANRGGLILLQGDIWVVKSPRSDLGPPSVDGEVSDSVRIIEIGEYGVDRKLGGEVALEFLKSGFVFRHVYCPNGMADEDVYIWIGSNESVGEVSVRDLRFTKGREKSSIVQTVEGRVAVDQQQDPDNEQESSDLPGMFGEEAEVEGSSGFLILLRSVHDRIWLNINRGDSLHRGQANGVHLRMVLGSWKSAEPCSRSSS